MSDGTRFYLVRCPYGPILVVKATEFEMLENGAALFYTRREGKRAFVCALGHGQWGRFYEVTEQQVENLRLSSDVAFAEALP